MKRWISKVAAAAALGGVLSLLLLSPLTATAGATTGLGYDFVIGIRLTNGGVSFTKQQHVPRGSTVQFLITNVSSARRWFVIGGRKTKLLRPKQREVFFLGFDRRGSFAYRSWGPSAKSYRGTFVVT